MCSSTCMSNSTDLLSHCITQENNLELIISTLCLEEANTSFHLCLKTMHPSHGIFHTFTCAQPQARPTQQIFFLIALHRRIIWSIISTLCIEEAITMFQFCLRYEPHTQHMGSLSGLCHGGCLTQL
jgi:hypothetical protein